MIKLTLVEQISKQLVKNYGSCKGLTADAIQKMDLLPRYDTDNFVLGLVFEEEVETEYEERILLVYIKIIPINLEENNYIVQKVEIVSK